MYIMLTRYDSQEYIDVATGRFYRYRDGKCFHKGSDDWICTGIAIMNNNGHVNCSTDLNTFVSYLQHDKQSLYYKNGKPKFRIRDLDHGTHRIWSEQIKSYNIHVVKTLPEV